jgi:hypothetical protein
MEVSMNTNNNYIQVPYGATKYTNNDITTINSYSSFVMEKSEFNGLCDIVISPNKTENVNLNLGINDSNIMRRVSKETVRFTKINFTNNENMIQYIKSDEVLNELYNLCKDITDGFILITNWNDYNLQGSIETVLEYYRNNGYELNKLPIFICYYKNHINKRLWVTDTPDFDSVDYFVKLSDLDTRLLTTEETFIKICKKIFGNNKED